MSVAELMGCHHTDKKRLEEKDCKQPKALAMQIPRQEAIVFSPVCRKTVLPAVAQRPVGRRGDLARLLGILAQYSALKPCFLLVTIYVHLLQGRLESGIFSHPQSF